MSDNSQIIKRISQVFGYTEQAREQRLDIMGINPGDSPVIKLIHQHIIVPHHPAIMDEFYDFLYSHKPTRRFIRDREVVARLKKTQTEYLLSFGIDYDSDDYFEYRLRVGLAHSRIGLPMSLYMAAYSELQTILLSYLSKSDIDDHELQLKCADVIGKFILLDMSLATDAYNLLQTKNLTDSIDQLQSDKQELKDQLIHDTLTNAYSRSYVMEVLGKRLTELQRDSSKQMAVALLDLDKFKNVNDTYGHQAGDQVLISLSETVISCIRQQDIFGRYGGEEFLLILVEMNRDKAFDLAERIRTTIASKTFTAGKHEIKLTVSIGLSVAHQGDTKEAIVERADKALYQAKSSGRNKTVPG